MSTHQPDDRPEHQTGAEAQPGTECHAVATEDPAKKKDEDESEALDEALDDSFPASDPPSQTAKIAKT